MTRVTITFLILYWLQYTAFSMAESVYDSIEFDYEEAELAAEPQDEYLVGAKELLESKRNLTAVKNCLLKSFTLYQNGEAAFILGKLHLFGAYKEARKKLGSTHLCYGSKDATSSEYADLYQANLTEELTLPSAEPNLTRAYMYFTYSHNLRYKDSGVFLFYIYTQASILSQPYTILPLLENVSYEQIFHIFNEAHLRGSFLASAVIANGIRICNMIRTTTPKQVAAFQGSSELPILTPKDVFAKPSSPLASFTRVPFVEGVQCENCNSAIMILIPVLTDVVAHLQKTGAASQPPSRLDTYHQSVVKNDDVVAKDVTPDLEIIRQQAEHGNVNSQIGLADSYFFGNPEYGIERDVAQAEHYYQMAAYENNDPHAQNALGIIKMQGIGTEKNETEAVRLLQSSAEQGHVDAMNGLGYAYLYGSGIEQNSTLSLYWYEKAALLNHTESEGNLGSLLQQGFEGIKKDERRAMFYLHRAAKKGHVSSIMNLAVLYVQNDSKKGFKVELSCWEILEMVREAVSKGNMNDFQLKGFKAYRDKDFDRSYTYYSFAALLGLPDSIHASAFIWETRPLKRFKCLNDDHLQCALAYYYRLYMTGDTKYLNEMGDIIYAGTKTEKTNPEIAFKLYNYSALLQENARALHSMGWMLENGIGIEKNLTQAIGMYDRLIKGYTQHKFEQAAYVAGLIQKTRLRVLEWLSRWLPVSFM